MGLKLENTNYFILTRDKNELIVTEFNDAYITHLRKEGWRTIDSFNVKQKRVIKK